MRHSDFSLVTAIFVTLTLAFCGALNMGCGSSQTGDSPQFNGSGKTANEKEVTEEDKTEDTKRPPGLSDEPQHQQDADEPNFDKICLEAGGHPSLDGGCNFCEMSEDGSRCLNGTSSVDLSDLAEDSDSADWLGFDMDTADRLADLFKGLTDSAADSAGRDDDSDEEETESDESEQEQPEEEESEEEESDSGYEPPGNWGGGGGCGC